MRVFPALFTLCTHCISHSRTSGPFARGHCVTLYNVERRVSRPTFFTRDRRRHVSHAVILRAAVPDIPVFAKVFAECSCAKVLNKAVFFSPLPGALHAE